MQADYESEILARTCAPIHLSCIHAHGYTPSKARWAIQGRKRAVEPSTSRQWAMSRRPSRQAVHPSHVHLFGHHDTQLLHLVVIQAKSSFNIFLNILSSSYVSGYYLQTTFFFHTNNLKDVNVLCWSADQLCLLLEFLRASSVSDSSPHMKEIRSLHPRWSAVALWRCRYLYACLGSAPHAPELLANQGWKPPGRTNYSRQFILSINISLQKRTLSVHINSWAA
jgi:hypothetical protein